MGDLRITSITPANDLIDRLRVVVDAHKDAILAGYELMLFGFDGNLAFYRQTVHPSISGQRGGRTLPLRWVKDRASERITSASNVTSFQFDVPLSTEALARLETFRDGGPLWCRLEGSFTVLAAERARAGQPRPKDPWVEAAVTTVREEFQRWTWPIQCECYELGREKWATEIYSRLRPVDRVFIEATIPNPVAEGEGPSSALEKLALAQSAFDQGRWAESNRECYIVAEILLRTMDGVAARYTDHRRELASALVTKVKSIANPERHDYRGPPAGDPDRPLAEFILTTLKAAIGFAYRG
jgi:hypothetical protein